jgi:hypothetical protein
MADALGRAIDARIDAYQPGNVPPIESVETRRPAHARRRAVATALVAAVAAAGVTVFPSGRTRVGVPRGAYRHVSAGFPNKVVPVVQLKGVCLPGCGEGRPKVVQML